MFGGYYRVDLDEKVTVIALNTMYYDSERDETKIDTESKGEV